MPLYYNKKLAASNPGVNATESTTTVLFYSGRQAGRQAGFELLHGKLRSIPVMALTTSFARLVNSSTAKISKFLA